MRQENGRLVADGDPCRAWKTFVVNLSHDTDVACVYVSMVTMGGVDVGDLELGKDVVEGGEHEGGKSEGEGVHSWRYGHCKPIARQRESSFLVRGYLFIELLHFDLFADP